ncbi:VOC family protein [Aquicoccus porphyridii]|uniref:VOC family protein n=2 Tax=Aquicoccus porphyridii TaxID=1852029 RepID=A0A5A9ZUS0_9RHOB|nr:VOC family protein [Aquicoccus porphyridii]KAA0920977.1 VOC family protein [Aquicoccus porphyridii]RAI56852.1 VOC family protein [Rhodobacteraceae bacterium AsT-22]
MAQTVSPYLCAKGAADALEFYREVFGAEELFRMTDPSGDGRLGHAEFRIGETVLFIADEYPDFGAVSPDRLGGTPVSLHVMVKDCDAVIAKARDAGATVTREPADQSYGERVGQFFCPWGHRWFVAQAIEDVSPAEMQSRWESGV